MYNLIRLNPDFIVVLVTCKNEENSIKNKGTIVFTLYIDFSDPQGQSKPLCMMIVLVTCKNGGQWKMKGLECSQHFSHYKSMVIFRTNFPAEFRTRLRSLKCPCYLQKSRRSNQKWRHLPHYNPIGAICCHGNIVLIQSGPKPNAAFPLHNWCFRWNLVVTGPQVAAIFMF